MKSITRYPLKLVLLFIYFAYFLTGEVSAQAKEPGASANGIHFTEGQWKEISSKAKKSGKYIFVDAYTTWCGPCKLLKSKTFLEDDVANYFNSNFINYTVDMEKGEGLNLADQWDVTAYPTLLFFSPEGKLLMRQVGFVNGDKLLSFGKQAIAVK